MTDSVVQESSDGGRRELIELSFPFHADLVVLARFAAATAAARAGFDVEEIEDLRLAIDELFVSIGPITEDGCVRLQLDRSADSVRIVSSFERFDQPRVAVEADFEEETWERAAELSELLLDSLVDEHGRENRDGASVAWLRKRRATTQ